MISLSMILMLFISVFFWKRFLVEWLKWQYTKGDRKHCTSETLVSEIYNILLLETFSDYGCCFIFYCRKTVVLITIAHLELVHFYFYFKLKLSTGRKCFCFQDRKDFCLKHWWRKLYISSLGFWTLYWLCLSCKNNISLIHQSS